MSDEDGLAAPFDDTLHLDERPSFHSKTTETYILAFRDGIQIDLDLSLRQNVRRSRHVDEKICTQHSQHNLPSLSTFQHSMAAIAKRTAPRTLHRILRAGRRQRAHRAGYEVLEHAIRDLALIACVFAAPFGDFVYVDFLEGAVEAGVRLATSLYCE